MKIKVYYRKLSDYMFFSMKLYILIPNNMITIDVSYYFTSYHTYFDHNVQKHISWLERNQIKRFRNFIEIMYSFILNVLFPKNTMYVDPTHVTRTHYITFDHAHWYIIDHYVHFYSFELFLNSYFSFLYRKFFEF